jgi:CRP-like cAMP-binding protein
VYEPLLRRLSHHDRPAPDAWAALTAELTPARTYAAGEEIIPQNAQPASSTLVLSGFAARVVQLQGGDQQLTAMHIRGDFVDLHSFLLPHLDHGVVALSACSTATIAHTALARISDAYPRLARALWYLTLVDAAVHRQWLTVIGRRPAAGRAAHLMCELYLRLQDVGLAQDHRFAFELTQAAFGDALCITQVHANRAIQALRRAGLLRWSQGVVEILDWDGLARLGEFDPTYLQLLGSKAAGGS